MLLVLAAYFDLKCYRVPNWLIISSTVMCIGLKCVVDGQLAAGRCFFDSGIVFAVVGPLFILKVLGAGDLKVLMVVGMFVGWRDGLIIFLLSLVMGAVVAAIQMSIYGVWGKRFRYLNVYIKRLKETGKITAYEDYSKKKEHQYIHFACIISAAAFIKLFAIPIVEKL